MDATVDPRLLHHGTVRPAHRQMGSKARVARLLATLIPQRTDVWVEVFAGTASVTLARPPDAVEHLNDLHGDVMHLFRVLIDPALRSALVERIELTPWSQALFEECLDGLEHGAAQDAVERAWQFLVVSWQTIAPQARSPRRSWRLERRSCRQLSVWAGLPERLAAVGQRLRRCYLHRRPAAEIVAMFADDPHATLFVDPPYPAEAINSHGPLYALEMSAAEHQALAVQLLECHCNVMLTMVSGTVYSRVLSGWHVRALPVRGLRGHTKTELLFTNYHTAQLGLFDPESNEEN